MSTTTGEQIRSLDAGGLASRFASARLIADIEGLSLCIPVPFLSGYPVKMATLTAVVTLVLAVTLSQLITRYAARRRRGWADHHASYRSWLKRALRGYHPAPILTIIPLFLFVFPRANTLSWNIGAGLTVIECVGFALYAQLVARPRYRRELEALGTDPNQQ